MVVVWDAATFNVNRNDTKKRKGKRSAALHSGNTAHIFNSLNALL